MVIYWIVITHERGSPSAHLRLVAAGSLVDQYYPPMVINFKMGCCENDICAI